MEVRPSDAGPAGSGDRAYWEDSQRVLLDRTENKLAEIIKFEESLTALRSTLQTLPDKTAHDIMVSMGSMAFFPGKLIHTNEITVLLGDNYFIERSAHQATGIVNRRLDGVKEETERLRKALENIKAEQKFSSQLDDYQALPEGGLSKPMEGEFEIREEYFSSEDEEDIGGGVDASSKATDDGDLFEAMGGEDVASLLERLAMLEREEAEKVELDEDNDAVTVNKTAKGILRDPTSKLSSSEEAELATLRLETKHTKKVTIKEDLNTVQEKPSDALTPADIIARFGHAPTGRGDDLTASSHKPVSSQHSAKISQRSSPYKSFVKERMPRPVTNCDMVASELQSMHASLVMQRGLMEAPQSNLVSQDEYESGSNGQPSTAIRGGPPTVMAVRSGSKPLSSSHRAPNTPENNEAARRTGTPKKKSLFMQQRAERSKP